MEKWSERCDGEAGKQCGLQFSSPLWIPEKAAIRDGLLDKDGRSPKELAKLSDGVFMKSMLFDTATEKYNPYTT